jgi:hypothetical protein
MSTTSQKRTTVCLTGVLALLLLTGCGTPLAPSFFDRWEKQRNALMETELALTEHPAGANNGEQLPNDGESKTGAKTYDGNQTDFFVPKTTTSDDVIDFYLNLFAKQHHQSIIVKCSTGNDPLELDYRYIEAAQWKNHYGYLVYIRIAHVSTTRDKYGSLIPTTRDDPLNVTVFTVANPKMPKPGSAAPINVCQHRYPLSRMAKILKPYALTPTNPTKNYRPPYDPTGAKF